MAGRSALIAHARASITRGSKSFRAASRLFDRPARERVWLLYAWCRACDDLVDAQDHGGAMGDHANIARSLATIRSLTACAFDGAATANPAFDAFGLVARETGLTPPMAEDVIAGFALDAANWRPQDEADMLRYCFHVAGAVGVMMAVVMGVHPDDDDTLDRASDLGIAFQLSNIARDLAEDAAAGRCYLPAQWLAEAGIAPAELMEYRHRAALVRLVARLGRLVERYEGSARIGAARLPFRRRWAVLAASGIYGAITREVSRRGESAWEQRVVTPRSAKLRHVARALLQAIENAPPPADAPQLSRRDLARLAR
ncbi:MAG: phytoene/squalene synthase family protein [Novosphingobium sp.]